MKSIFRRLLISYHDKNYKKYKKMSYTIPIYLEFLIQSLNCLWCFVHCLPLKQNKNILGTLMNCLNVSLSQWQGVIVVICFNIHWNHIPRDAVKL